MRNYVDSLLPAETAMRFRNTDLALVMPVSWDRINWQSTDDIVVMAFDSTTLNQVGYRTNDSVVAISPYERLGYPLIAVGSLNPDIDRFTEVAIAVDSLYPRTVSTILDEYHLASPERNYSDWPESRHIDDCVNLDAADDDLDGISDKCELLIASEFVPVLRFDSEEKDAERMTLWEVRSPDASEVLKTQEHPRRLQRLPDRLWIFYALGYYNDPGYKLLPFTNHRGDSEFVVMAIRRVEAASAPTDSWIVTKICFYAHWGAPAEHKECLDASSEKISYGSGEDRGRPVVFVARGKHGNYVDPDTCMEYEWYFPWTLLYRDKCEGPFGHGQIRLTMDQKLGPYRPDKEWKVSSASTTASQTGTERLWSDADFCGWNTDRSNCADTYLFSLRAYSFFQDDEIDTPN